MGEQGGSTALRAVLFADLADFSRLIARDEVATLEFVERCFSLFRQLCAQFGGQFVKTTGDGVLVLFDSASRALDYAVCVQSGIAELAAGGTGPGRFRIGVHMGEVHLRDMDAYGHTINLAARLQQEAEPGGICVSQDVYRATHGTSPYRFRFAGRPLLKNMPQPLSLYHVIAGEAHGAAASGTAYRMSVIDGLAIRDDGGDSVLPRSRRLQALIGYLAMSGELQEAKNRVAALIWPDRGLPEGRAALTRCLQGAARAGLAGADDLLWQNDSMVGLRHAAVTVDVVRILEGLREGRIEDLLLWRTGWTEAILLGYEDISPLYAAWLRVTRHGWRDRIIEALEAALLRFEAAEPGLARTATALLNLDETHERAAQSLMRHHEAAGNPGAGMRVYTRIAEVLRERFGLEPAEQTRQLATALSAREPATGEGGAAPGSARVPGIVVGAFNAPEAHVFHAAAFRSELIANLSKFREWVVHEARESEQIPGADYRLGARCAARQDSVRLIVTLAETASQRVVWSERFDLTLSNWFAVQKQLVGMIASTLEVYLSHDRLSRLQHRPVQDLGAYDAWLRGENLLTRWSTQAEDEAEALFERVIVADPGFAPAYASLASVCNSRHFIRPGIGPDPERRAQALRLARKAVELDPIDARNHLVVAWSSAMAGQFEQCELHYGLAVDLNPNSPRTLISASLGLAFAGCTDLAASLLGQAMRLTSMFLEYQWSHIATIRYLLGDLEGAIEAAERSGNLIIDTPGWRAAALLRLGREPEARAAVDALITAVSARWAGPAAASADQVLDWFLGAFPIRRQETLAELAALRRFGGVPPASHAPRSRT